MGEGGEVLVRGWGVGSVGTDDVSIGGGRGGGIKQEASGPWVPHVSGVKEYVCG